MTHRRAEELTLTADAERVEAVVRALAASVNVRLLGVLAAERRKRGDEGWLHLSDVAEHLGEAPGTVSAAVGKLLLADLVEERREKGRRWFRARVTDVEIGLKR